jgi:hypothetical protein
MFLEQCSIGRMTTADQLAIVNRLLQAPAEAYTLAQVPAAFFPVPFAPLSCTWVPTLCSSKCTGRFYSVVGTNVLYRALDISICQFLSRFHNFITSLECLE